MLSKKIPKEDHSVSILFGIILCCLICLYVYFICISFFQFKDGDVTEYQISSLSFSLACFISLQFLSLGFSIFIQKQFVSFLCYLIALFFQFLMLIISSGNFYILLLSWSIIFLIGFYRFRFYALALCIFNLSFFYFICLINKPASFISLGDSEIGLIQLSLIAFFSTSLGFIFHLARKIQSGQREIYSALMYERQINKQLSVFNTDLQWVAQKQGTVSAENECNRITREMHDANGYHFTNIIALMNAAISNGDNCEWSIIEDILQTTLEQAHKGLKDSRAVLYRLRESFQEYQHSDLPNEINLIIKIFMECTGIKVVVNWGNLTSDYDKNLTASLCRIIQEGLVNAVKHGHATIIQISFWESDFLSMIISDNGVGSEKIVKGIGLAGMEERLKEIGGELHYENIVDNGFRLMVEIPLNRKEF